jgi:hypothetical protein
MLKKITKAFINKIKEIRTKTAILRPSRLKTIVHKIRTKK